MNIKALVQLDVISGILCLYDITTNSSNCGQVGDQPIIVDFEIETQAGGYVKLKILHGFYQGNGEYKYSGLMATAVGIPEQEKVDILKTSLLDWDLLDTFDKTLLDMTALVQNCGGTIKFTDDLERYTRDVKATVEILDS
jgi:hypothetical protein